MRSNNHSRLEKLIASHSKKNSPEINNHPHEFIANHVLLLAFIALLFLGAIAMFFMAEPSANTAYALVEIPEINIDFDFGITDKLTDVYNVFMDTKHRDEFRVITYLCWILIVGALNLYMVEKDQKKTEQN